MNTKFYLKTLGADIDALSKCIDKAIDIAKKDKEIEKIVLLSYTQRNFATVMGLFGERLVKEMFSGPKRLLGCTKSICCATLKTYKNYRAKDIVICCHMDSDAVFKVDDFVSAKYIIALSWTLDGLDKWIVRWNAENIDNNINTIIASKMSPIAEIALKEMDVRMLETKCMGHPDDTETCKTYIRAINKYIPEVTDDELVDYLVTELGWTNKNASEVGVLLKRLKDGGRFVGGAKTGLQEHYKRWKDKLKNKD